MENSVKVWKARRSVLSANKERCFENDPTVGKNVKRKRFLSLFKQQSRQKNGLYDYSRTSTNERLQIRNFQLTKRLFVEIMFRITKECSSYETPKIKIFKTFFFPCVLFLFSIQ